MACIVMAYVVMAYIDVYVNLHLGLRADVCHGLGVEGGHNYIRDYHSHGHTVWSSLCA